MRYAPHVGLRLLPRAAAWLAAAWVLALAAPARATMPPASGPLAPEIAQAFARGLFAPPERPAGPQTSSARSDWLLPIIRVAFSDSAIVYPKAMLEQRLFDTTGAVPTGS